MSIWKNEKPEKSKEPIIDENFLLDVVDQIEKCRVLRGSMKNTFTPMQRNNFIFDWMKVTKQLKLSGHDLSKIQITCKEGEVLAT